MDMIWGAVLSLAGLWFIKVLLFGTKRSRQRERERQARLRWAREMTANDRPEWVQNFIQWTDENF